VNYTYSLIQINSNLGGIALRKYDWKTTEMYSHKVLKLALEFGNVEGYCAATRTLAYLESYKGNFHKAEEYILDVLEHANEFDLPTEKRDCYIFLGDLSFARHDAITYRIYAGKADSISQAITSQRIIQDSKEMDVKYETAKKDFEIEHQQNIIARQTMQRWLFVGGIGALMVILIIFLCMLRLRARRNRELAEINLTKDKLFNIISHDLRNPAVAQRDALLALVKNARIWDADTLANYHVELLKSAEGEVELIYNLLKWAQLQTGRIACNPEVFPLSDFHPSLSLIHKMAENKEITLDVQIPENAFITGDYNILITVIRNLLTNAIKFTASGGTVTLDISPYKTTQYTISISDTGTGISKKQLHDLFRLDNSHSNTGTAGEQGTGLGLIVCKELLEKHGGKLYVESEEGKGSRFWFIVEANSKL
jgi:signal transduction histidine kinase